MLLVEWAARMVCEGRQEQGWALSGRGGSRFRSLRFPLGEAAGAPPGRGQEAGGELALLSCRKYTEGPDTWELPKPPVKTEPSAVPQALWHFCHFKNVVTTKGLAELNYFCTAPLISSGAQKVASAS